MCCFRIRHSDEDSPRRPARHGRRGGGRGNTGYTYNGAGHMYMPPQYNGQSPADEATRKAASYNDTVVAAGGNGYAQGKVDDETKLTPQQLLVPAWQHNKAGAGDDATTDDHHMKKPMDFSPLPKPSYY